MSEIPEVFAIFEQKLAHVLSFNLRQNGQKKAIEELLVYFSGIVGRASKAEARIAELEEEQRWIPVSERLPEDMQRVLIVINGEFERPSIGLYLSLFGRDGFYGTATHWLPLPEPPEVK